MVAQFTSLEEMWEAGRKTKRSGNNSVLAKVGRSLVPAVSWALWLTRNASIFRGQWCYVENTWGDAVGFIMVWGNFVQKPGQETLVLQILTIMEGLIPYLIAKIKRTKEESGYRRLPTGNHSSEGRSTEQVDSKDQQKKTKKIVKIN
ncbi:hypothetical protein QJS04_geneDACA000997 [Acorus gramineus]|uniref:Uncharacterized protein n=1 Tax=Acorus gramineus TaxID=55184 RepID=A0AAV9AC73_ACOGR|nr:hypothetical protein QJS04_geneDACA000997 [Acorus gramineus]